MIRPAGQAEITTNTPLSQAEATGAVVVAGTSVFVGNLLHGAFWGALAALVVNVVQRGKRRSSRR